MPNNLGRPANLRRRFIVALCYGVRIVWPILSGLVAMELVLGIIVGFAECWSLGESVYFTFVTGLTIGYGDLAPTRPLSRLLAVLIGVIGALVIALFAAVGVRALQIATSEPPD